MSGQSVSCEQYKGYRMNPVYWCFPGGLHKALTLSYDDGKIADRRLVSVLNRYDIRATFHLNAGKFSRDGRISEAEVASLYAGHEISAHSFTHPTLTRLPREQIIQQILEDRRGLEQLAGYPVRGISYPNGAFNSDIASLLPHLGMSYARTTHSTAGFDLPEDWFRWKPTCHHNEDLLALADKFVSLNKQHMPYLFYVWGHSYDFDQDNNWDLLDEFCSKVSRKADTWYATNIEIVDYMDAVNRLCYSVNCDQVYNPSSLTIWIKVTDNFHQIPPGKIYALSH